MVEAIFTLGSGLLILLLGLLVVYGSVHDTLRQTFLGFCLAMSFWQVTLYFSERNIANSLLMNRLTFIGPVFAALLFYEFTRGLSSRSTIKLGSKILDLSYVSTFVWLVATIGTFLAVSPWVVTGIRPRIQEGIVVPGYDLNHGVAYGVYIAILLLLLVLSLTSVYLLSRDREAMVRKQARVIRGGLLAAVLVGLFANVVLPAVLHSSEFSYLGSVTVIILGSVLAVAIAKHKLIDVRSFVARSFGYALSISVIGLVYFLAVVFLIRQLTGDTITSSAELILGVMIIVSAVIFKPIKQWFDQLTNRIFFQDTYDPQALYTQLNGMLVTSLDVGYLMRQSITMIEQTLKTEYVVMGLRDGNGEYRIFSTRKMALDEKDFKLIQREAESIKNNKVTTIALLNEAKAAHYKKYMIAKDVGVVVRLAQSTNADSDGFGFLVLGVKKSGNAYTQQDANVLDTVGNELTIAIQNALHYEEIQKFNIELQARISEATRKLRKTNEKLKSLDETKDDFISMASHQLRTPLTSVKGYLSMVLDGDAGKINDTQRKMLSQAYTSSQHMVYLIADLLNVSRLRTGKFIIEGLPTDLSQMINEEIGQLTETAAARGLTLTYEAPAEFPMLLLDQTKTRQVIMNFIDNAIYYTPKGGHIKVELRDTGPMIELRVSDDGIGVPKSEQHHLFTKFYRAGNARQARPDGTGLGLFMAKKVIMAQGGAVLFESQEGKGSTFGFTFSKEALATAAQPAARLTATEAAIAASKTN